MGFYFPDGNGGKQLLETGGAASLPVATDSVLGGVKVGKHLKTTGDSLNVNFGEEIITFGPSATIDAASDSLNVSSASIRAADSYIQIQRSQIDTTATTSITGNLHFYGTPTFENGATGLALGGLSNPVEGILSIKSGDNHLSLSGRGIIYGVDSNGNHSRINLPQKKITLESGLIDLDATDDNNGGTISACGSGTGSGGVLNLAGGSLSRSGSIIGAVHFTHTPVLENGIEGLPTATSVKAGVVKVGTGLAMNGDTLSRSNDFSSQECTLTGASITGNHTVTGDVTFKNPVYLASIFHAASRKLYLNDATLAGGSSYGHIHIDSDYVLFDNHPNIQLPGASVLANGASISANLASISGNPTFTGTPHFENGATGLNYELPTASTSTKGGVKVGTGLQMNGDTLNCTVQGGLSNPIEGTLIIKSGQDGGTIDMHGVTGGVISLNGGSGDGGTIDASGGGGDGGTLNLSGNPQDGHRGGTINLAGNKGGYITFMPTARFSQDNCGSIAGCPVFSDGFYIGGQRITSISNGVVLDTVPSTVEGAMWYVL